ncbi:MAG: hypothetical protein JSR46_02215 [Verrucomicrobia bacterium]|nr:hypothetical protein [Verrucomicrobiota bacterium]
MHVASSAPVFFTDLPLSLEVYDDKKLYLMQLCTEIEGGNPKKDVSARVQEHIAKLTFTRRDQDALQIVKLLHRHSLLPELRQQIMEKLIATPQGYKGAEEVVDGARLSLALDYLMEDQNVTKATPLIEMQMERLLRGSNREAIDFCLFIVTNFSILPAAKEMLARRMSELKHEF